jgi:hypothetical protein
VCAEKQIVAGPKTSRNPDSSIVRGGYVGLINCSAPLRGREHPATRLLDDAVVRDGWPITARIYVCETGESMKVAELAAAQEGRWRNMYGPPPECKKNWVGREAVCENVSGL